MKSSNSFGCIVRMYLTYLFLQLCQCVDFSVKPENTYYTLGSGSKLVIPCSMVDLQCLPDGSVCDSVFWLRVDGADEIVISRNDILEIDTGKYSIEGEYSLVINDVTADDAGTYMCSNGFEPLAEGSMELIVLESDPVCSNDPPPALEEEEVSVSCSITYYGRWAPIMTFFDSTGLVQSADDVISGNDVSYVFTFVTQKADNGDVIRCQTNFSRPLDPPVTSEVEASNSPSYNYNATFNIEVHYPPNDTEIKALDVANTTHLPIGTILRCDTDANPQPTQEQIVWKPSEAGDVLATGSEIEVVEEWEGQIITLLCVVTNTMVGRGEGAADQDEVVFEVYAVEPSDELGGGAIGGIVVVVLAIVAVAGIVAVIFIRRMRPEEEDPEIIPNPEDIDFKTEGTEMNRTIALPDGVTEKLKMGTIKFGTASMEGEANTASSIMF